ncbi:MAG TPA: UbiX family flavin prenyltransferase [Chitinophagales bacterium]|nr:UbiX family flavin prenyltransferase [Chitinophagales bacterium]
MGRRIVIGITGASGAIYAQVLLDAIAAMKEPPEAVGVVMSSNAKTVWQHELGQEMPDYPAFHFYASKDFMAPFASGSAQYDTMIICPCSMGTMGRIAAGISNDLMTRAADVVLKERRKLILVARETPYSLIHLRNMETITLAGGIICPATPSFYSRPSDMRALAATVTDRVLDLAGFSNASYRWGNS